MHEASGRAIVGGHLSRRLIALGVAALGALAILGVSARDAGAQDPFDFTLNHGRIQLGGLPEQPLFETTPATFTGGTIEEDGSFQVPAEGISLPPMSVAVQPFAVDIAMAADGPLTGTFDEATGAVDASMVLISTVDIEINNNFIGTCLVTMDLSFSTSNIEPYPGIPFTEGVDGPGAVAADWPSLPASVPTLPAYEQTCAGLDSFASGPGGVWLSHDIENPPEPLVPARLSKSVSPLQRTVKAGRSARFRVEVENTGDISADDVEVCLRAPNALGVKVLQKRAQKCASVGALEGGQTKSRVFKVTTKRNTKPKQYTLSITANGAPSPGPPSFATLKVQKRKRR